MPTSSQPSDRNIEGNLHLIFLPGLHGTSELFDHLVEQLKLQVGSFQSTLISYPTDRKQSYKKLFKWLCTELALDQNSSDRKTVIIAESFSTPLALRLADKFPQQINALVIGGGFCSSPANPAFSLFPLRLLFMLVPPPSAVRHFLTGPESSSELVDKVRATIKNVSSKILSQRIRSVLTLEEEKTPIAPDTPILLLQAEHDAIISWETQNQLEQHLPHAQSHWLNSPHLIMQVHPEICASSIAEFLDQT
jgi:pimeloyl-[acyl-carrier protein] methyl ester esterase